jgi:phytoene/squalene synthetase
MTLRSNFSAPPAATIERLELVESGREASRSIVARRFGRCRWMLSGLSDGQRADAFVVLHYLSTALDLMAEVPEGLTPGTDLEAIRDELRQTNMGRGSDPLAVGVIELAERLRIPKEYVFQVIEGIDLWTRFRRFTTYDDLAHFACKVGGGAMNLLVPVIEFERPNYERAAIFTGQAVALTQVLASVGSDLQHGRCLLPQQWLTRHKLQPDDLQLERDRVVLCQLIRELACRIELDFYEGGPLLHHLSFDGKRVLKSLLAWHWELLNKLKHEPAAALAQRVELSRSEMARLRLKHLLGTEGAGVPIVAAPEESGH